MTIKIWVDRSRVLERERCDRKRWLVYHESGTGIVPKRTPLALGVGGAVHAGLARLLQDAQAYLNHNGIIESVIGSVGQQIEDQAVATALADFSSHAAGLELDANESAGLQGQTPEAKQLAEQMIVQARELGMAESDIAGITAGVDPAVARSEFERYLFAEQSALVEGLVRAYARRRLRPLLEEFEVLEVEREGEWKLGEWGGDLEPHSNCQYCHGTGMMDSGGVDPQNRGINIRCDCTYAEPTELYFMSRPDALLRHRQTNELYLLSFKTTGQWDVRKAKDIEHDMQGLSEGVEVEKRLGEWWDRVRDMNNTRGKESQDILNALMADGITQAMLAFLSNVPAPPRIHAIRYEFLLKGERWKDKELSQRLGVDVRSQKSHLIRQYVATSTPKKGEGGYSVGDVAWSWEFTRPEDNKESKLAWQNWKSRPVWEEEK